MTRIKSVATAAVFAIILLGFGIAHLVLPDKAVSEAERRKLAQTPEISLHAIFNGDFTEDAEEYLLDQFPLRETLRRVKSLTQFYLLGQMDSNGIYLYDGSAVKMEAVLNETQVSYAANKIKWVQDNYLPSSRVFYAVIPDKNYYAADISAHLSYDYARVDEILAEALPSAQCIKLYDLLSLDDYYSTDAHWRQESIYPVAQSIVTAMGTTDGFVPLADYTVNEFSPFYGVYYGQSALPLAPDTLRYLSSLQTDAAVVTGVEFSGERKVYEQAQLSNMDSYDVFLSGAQALLEIELPDTESEKELIIFRDSFGSSLAPYLLGAYSKITLVDLRYISSAILSDYVEFNGQDVLFLYSSDILNNGMLLK